MNKNTLITGCTLILFGMAAYSLMDWIKTDYPEPSCAKVIKHEEKSSFCAPPAKNTDKIQIAEANFNSKDNDEKLIKPLVLAPEFNYNIDTRYVTRISRKDVYEARTISDVIPDADMEKIVSSHKNMVSILYPEGLETKYGDGNEFTEEQVKLLNKIEYSDNFYIYAECIQKNETTGYTNTYDLIYYLSVVPETEAVYRNGNGALIDYLKNASKALTNDLSNDVLRPGMMSFTDNKEARISDVKVESGCGYETLDKHFINLIENMPGEWTAAKNYAGENVDQEFIFFYGQVGC